MSDLQVFVAEFLHADSAAFQNASASIKREGRAMLLAVLDDLAKCANVAVTCRLCAEAGTALHEARQHRPQIRFLIQTAMNAQVDLVRQLEVPPAAAADADYDAVLVIAPEDGGLLQNLTEAIQTPGRRLISPDSFCVQLGSDKWQTYKWLISNNLPTIPTSRCGDKPSDWPTADLYVTKPVDGAGGEEVRRTAQPKHQAADAADRIVQPFIRGAAFSIAVLGQGPDRPAFVLPLVRQQTRWHQQQPVYSGGIIRPNVPAAIEAQAQQLAATIARRLKLTDGYLGIDLLWPEDADQLLVMELNPRFCSSYVGYRRATGDNLMERLLFPAADTRPFQWHAESTTFELRDDGC